MVRDTFGEWGNCQEGIHAQGGSDDGTIGNVKPGMDLDSGSPKHTPEVIHGVV